MPNLDLHASREFWKNYEDPSIYKVIAFMETVEGEVCKGTPQLEESLQQLGEALDQLDQFELRKEDEWISMCAHLHTSRILRILQAIDMIEPGAASRLLMYAEEHSQAENKLVGLFLRRNIVFERLRLLARAFSKERFQLALKVLGQEEMG